jgi:hypothetical protein
MEPVDRKGGRFWRNCAPSVIPVGTMKVPGTNSVFRVCA